MAFIAAPAFPEYCGEGGESQQQDNGLADKTDECCAEERRTLARPPCVERLKPSAFHFRCLAQDPGQCIAIG